MQFHNEQTNNNGLLNIFTFGMCLHKIFISISLISDTSSNSFLFSVNKSKDQNEHGLRFYYVYCEL